MRKEAIYFARRSAARKQQLDFRKAANSAATVVAPNPKTPSGPR